MKVMLLLYSEEGRWMEMNDAERGEAIQAYIVYTQQLREAGKLIAGDELNFSATARRVVGRDLRVQDGPYSDSKEQLGGYYLIEVADMDEAVIWAKRCPTPLEGGTVEIRPLMSQT